MKAVRMLLRRFQNGDDLDGEMEEEQLRQLSEEDREKFIESRSRQPSRQAEATKQIGKQRIERVRIIAGCFI